MPVRWDWEWACEVTPIDGDGEVVLTGGHATGHRVLVSRPGRYRVSLGAIPGYEPVEDAEVEVRAGALTDVRFDLIPRR